MRWHAVAAAALMLATARAQQKTAQPAKLLYPIMIQGGPNNQYQQFLESMVLAKTLRRKIVLAPFLSWPGGGDRQRVHAFAATFDVDAVKKFVDVVSTKDMGEASTTIVTAGGDCPLHDCCVASYETLYRTSAVSSEDELEGDDVG